MATRARHFMALPRVGWPAAPLAMPQRGGGRKSGAKALASTTAPLIDRVFSLDRTIRDGWQKWRRQAGRERPAELLGPSLAQMPRRFAPWPWRPDPGALADGVCNHPHRPVFRPNIFPFSGRRFGSYELQGNSGNMGTVTIKQAERLAFEGCQPVPKASGRFGNMGTEMADPDAGKSARVWPSRTPASR